MQKYSFAKKQWLPFQGVVDVDKYDVIYGSPTAGKTYLGAILFQTRRVFTYDTDWFMFESEYFKALKELHNRSASDPVLKDVWAHLSLCAWNQAMLIQKVKPEVKILTNLQYQWPLMRLYHTKKVVGFLRSPDLVIEEMLKRCATDHEREEKRNLMKSSQHWIHNYRKSWDSGHMVEALEGLNCDLFALDSGEYMASAFGLFEEKADGAQIKKTTIHSAMSLLDKLRSANVPLLKAGFKSASEHLKNLQSEEGKKKNEI